MADNRPSLQQYARQLETELGLPSGIADTLVKTESGGNPYAVSPKGAIGLTQLMPDTAKELGVNPHDPYDNLKGGLSYFAKHYNTFNQNPVLAAAAYNAGPNSIGLKSRDTTKLPQETQNYMSKFTGYLNQKPTKTGLSQEEAIALGLEDAPEPKPGLSQEEAIALGLEEPSTSKLGLSQEEAIALGLEEPRTLSSALKEGVGNLPSSIGENVLNTAKALWNAPETATGIKDIIAGEALKLAPKSTLEKSLKYAQMEPTGDKVKDKAIEQAKEVVKAYNTATMFNQNLANRYGGEQEVLNTLATDPAGLLLDLAPVGTGAVKGITAGAKAVGKYVGTTPTGMTEFIRGNLPKYAGTTPTGVGGRATVELGPDLTNVITETAGNKKAAEYASKIGTVLNPIQKTGEFISNAPSEITSLIFNKGIAPLSKTAISKWSGMTPEDISAAYNSGRISGEALSVPMSDVSSPFNKITPQLQLGNTPIKSAIVAGQLLTGNIPSAIASYAAASPRTVGLTAKTLGAAYSIPEELNILKKNIQPYRGSLNAVERLNQQIEQNPETLYNTPNLPNSILDNLASLTNTAMGIAPNSQYDNPDIFGYGVTPTAQHTAAANLSTYALGLNKPSGRPGLFNKPKGPDIQGPAINPIDYTQYEKPAYERPTERFNASIKNIADAKQAKIANTQDKLTVENKGLLNQKVEPVKTEDFNAEDYFNTLLTEQEASIPKVEIPTNTKISTINTKPEDILSIIRNRNKVSPEEQLFANLENKAPSISSTENDNIKSGLLSRKRSSFEAIQDKIKQSQEVLPMAPEDAVAYDKWMKAHENRSIGQSIRRQIDKDAKQYTYVTSDKNKKSVDIGLLSDLEKAYNTTFDYSTLPNINNMGLKEARKTIRKWTVDQIKSTGGVKGGLLGGSK